MRARRRPRESASCSLTPISSLPTSASAIIETRCSRKAFPSSPPPALPASFELPAVPPELRQALSPSEQHVVMDVGGDPEGAAFLAGFAEEITARGYDLWFVANPYRPATPDAESLVAAAEEIAAQSGPRLHGLRRESSPRAADDRGGASSAACFLSKPRRER